jgi:hypothetical protein
LLMRVDYQKSFGTNMRMSTFISSCEPCLLVNWIMFHMINTDDISSLFLK